MKVQFLDKEGKAVQPEIEGTPQLISNEFNLIMAKLAKAAPGISAHDKMEEGVLTRTMSDGHVIKLYTDTAKE